MTKKRNYKIAVLLNGGIAQDSRVINICQSLSKIGEVHLFYINKTKYDSTVFKEKNIVLHYVDKPNSTYHRILKHSLIHKEYNFFYNPVISTEINFDLIYANDFPTLNIAYKLKKHFGCKIIYDSHEIYISTLNQFFDFENLPFYKLSVLKFALYLMQFFGKKAEKKLVKKVDYMLTVNESLRDYFIKKYRVNNIDFLYNVPKLASNMQVVENLRTLTKCHKDDVIFLYQGVLNKGRGIELMIQAFSKTKNMHSKLIIIGDGILSFTLKKMVKKYNIENNVVFLGTVEQEKLSAYTVQADFAIFFLEDFNISTTLASPNKIFQYIHAEVPVITNHTPENDKIFKEYKIGMQTQLSIEAITETIDKATENVSNRLQHILECKKAKQVYNWENQEKKLLKIVKSLL